MSTYGNRISMKEKIPFRLSDAFTTLRIFGVAAVALIISSRPEFFGLIPGLFLIIFIFFTDTFDGIIARKFNEESEFGPFYDITGDRVAEIVFLVPFVYLNITQPYILIFFVVKGFLIDYRRFWKYVKERQPPFKQLKSPISKFLVGSPIMRQLIQASKIGMVCAFYATIFIDSQTLDIVVMYIPIFTIIISLFRTIPPYVDNSEI